LLIRASDLLRREEDHTIVSLAGLPAWGASLYRDHHFCDDFDLRDSSVSFPLVSDLLLDKKKRFRQWILTEEC